jgi:hypothetical protein
MQMVMRGSQLLSLSGKPGGAHEAANNILDVTQRLGGQVPNYSEEEGRAVVLMNEDNKAVERQMLMKYVTTWNELALAYQGTHMHH